MGRPGGRARPAERRAARQPGSAALRPVRDRRPPRRHVGLERRLQRGRRLRPGDGARQLRRPEPARRGGPDQHDDDLDQHHDDDHSAEHHDDHHSAEHHDDHDGGRYYHHDDGADHDEDHEGVDHDDHYHGGADHHHRGGHHHDYGVDEQHHDHAPRVLPIRRHLHGGRRLLLAELPPEGLEEGLQVGRSPVG